MFCEMEIFLRKKVFLMFREMELFSPKNKIFQEGTVRARKIKKKTHSDKNFLYFGKWNFRARSF